MNKVAEQHLARAKDYVARGEEFYRKAAEEIVAAQNADPTISNREIGAWFGRSKDWVRDIVRWSTNGEDTRTPYGLAADPTQRERNARAIIKKESPERVAEIVAEAPPATRRAMMRRLAEVDAKEGSEAFERRTREYGKDWHDYASEALQLLAESRRAIKKAYDAVESADRTGQLEEERVQLIVASAQTTKDAAEFVKERARGHNFERELGDLLAQES